MKKVLIAIVGLTIFSLTALFAQPGDPGGDPDIPITGGLGYLLAAGIGYGMYALKKRKKG
jgi:hypothetical protein